MPLSDDDVREILRIIDESELDELRIETDGLRLHLRRGGAPPNEEPMGSGAPDTAERTAPDPEPPAAPERASDGQETTVTVAERDGTKTIDAPMVGTIYRAEAPDAKPFVEVGSRVEPDTVVCLIEVMKMMNPIQAGVSGTIVEVCAENGTLMEYGQPLFRVELA